MVSKVAIARSEIAFLTKVIRNRLACPVLVLLCVCLVGGCAARWRRPVSDDVILSRQLSIRGLEAQAHNQWDEAEALYRQAIVQCPANEQARRNFADSLWRRGQQKEALAQMVEAVRLSGGDPEMTVALGRMYLALGVVDPAEELAERALRSDPHRAAAWALLGDVRRQQGDTAEALASYHRALTYQAEYPEVQIAAADLYQAIGKPRRALSTLDAVIDRYPTGSVPTEMLIRRGDVLADLGRHQESAETFLAAVKRGNPEHQLLVRLGEEQLAAGDPAAARLAFIEAVRLAPHENLAKQRLAEMGDIPTRIALDSTPERIR